MVHSIMTVTDYYFFKIFLSLKIDFVLVNNAGPDEMPQYAAFHLPVGLHFLPKNTDFGVFSLQKVK